jgi:membrane-associated phospholipid phosphatase
MIQINSIWDFISILVIIGPYTAIYELLDGKIALIIGILITMTIEKNVKRLTHSWYPSIFKRPDAAKDCSILNDGGPVGTRGGFPSGHMAVASFFSNMLYFRQENRDNKTFLLYSIPSLLMALARYMKSCHNMAQIIAGYLLGLGVSYGIYKFEETYVKKKKD